MTVWTFPADSYDRIWATRASGISLWFFHLSSLSCDGATRRVWNSFPSLILPSQKSAFRSQTSLVSLLGSPGLLGSPFSLMCISAGGTDGWELRLPLVYDRSRNQCILMPIMSQRFQLSAWNETGRPL